jgi:uncharacterized protein YjbI with pentapeptide repeats
MPNDDPPRDFADWIGLSQPPNWTKSRQLGSLIGVILVFFALFLVGAAGWLIIASLQSSASATPGATLGAGGLIVALLSAPFLIWNTIIKQKALGFQKEGHITDRISKAVEQLGAEKTIKRQRINDTGKRVYEKDAEGNPDFAKPVAEEVTVPNIEVRIGGILSLERVAQDSCAYDRGRDHVRVMEILCAYVRENASATNLDPTPIPFVKNKARLDIQKAIDAIKRRSHEQRELEAQARYRLDLRETNLDGCDLSQGHFAGAVFVRSRLEAADLSRTDFSGALMLGCLFNHAQFHHTLFRGAILNFATLNAPTTSSFGHADLRGTFIEGADMTSLYISSRNADELFGSQDTVLANGQNELKNGGLQAAIDLDDPDLAENSDARLTIIDSLEERARMFLHWNPYTADDLAAHHYRQKFKVRKDLIGWPYDA